MKAVYTFSILALLLCVACGETDQKKTESPEAKEVQDAKPTDQPEVSPAPQPADDEIHEFGQVINIEDSGYPFHIVTLDFPERQMQRSFNLNVESGIISLEKLVALQDQYVNVYYTTEDEVVLYDLHSKGTSLLGKYAPDSIEEFKKLTGVLSGAEEVTPGDLPGEITITSEDGESQSFEYFVTEDLVEINGQEVTVYYDILGRENITRIEASENS